MGLLALAGFLSAIGARIIDPMLAILAQDFGTSVAGVSVLVAAFTFPYACNQLILGPIGDRFGKLRVLLGALAGYAVFMSACALAADLPTLVVLRACSGAASGGLIPTCLAYIGDSVAYEERQIALSRFLTGVVLGQSLAGPVGGVFSELFGWRYAFALLGCAGLVVAIALIIKTRGLRDPRSDQTAFNRDTYLSLLRHRPARLLLGVTVIEGILLPGAFPFIAPYLVERFELSYLVVGLILSSFGVGALGYTHGAGRLLKRLGEPGLVLCGGLLVAATLLAALELDSWILFIAVPAALGLGYFMLHSVMQTRATELLPVARSTAVSLFIFMLFLGQGLGALLMGGAIALWGYRTAYHLDLLGIILLSLWLANYMRRRYEPGNRD